MDFDIFHFSLRTLMHRSGGQCVHACIHAVLLKCKLVHYPQVANLKSPAIVTCMSLAELYYCGIWGEYMKQLPVLKVAILQCNN